MKTPKEPINHFVDGYRVDKTEAKVAQESQEKPKEKK